MVPARVLSVLPDPSHQRLARLLPAAWPVDRVTVAAVHTRALPGTVIVTDPAALGPEQFRSLLDAAANAGAAVLLYTPVPSGQTVKLITDSTELGLPVELVFFEADDERDVLRCRIGQIGQASAPALVFRRLASRILDLRPELSARVVPLFGWTSIPNETQFLRGLECRRASGESMARCGATCATREAVGRSAHHACLRVGTHEAGRESG